MNAMKRKTTLFRFRNLLLIILLFIGCDDDDFENGIPSFISINNQEMAAGETKSIIITATDVNGDSLNLYIKNNPGFLSLKNVDQHNDVVTATLIIAPEKNVAGVFDVCIVASDSRSAICENKFKIVVNKTKILESVSRKTVTTGRTIDFFISAFDTGGGELTFNLRNNPEFVYIDKVMQVSDKTIAKLVIAPKKDDKGEYQVTVDASGEHGGVDSKIIEIEVNDPINVVTIYFCGTGCTKDWWDPNRAAAPLGVSGFWVPELVATLHHEQSIEKDSIHDYYKYIVDGIGVGNFESGNTVLLVLEALKAVLGQGFPSMSGIRGWTTCLNEAISFLDGVVDNSKGEVILNLVGFSRGGVLCFMMAKESNDTKYSRVGGVNIIAFDPVPGDETNLLQLTYELNEKVKHYVGVYAEDERTNLFHPIIPDVASLETKLWMFTLPGSHETMVGNNQKDGHSIDFYNIPFLFPLNEIFEPELLKVSWVSKVMAKELLGSSSWGNVKLDWNWSKNKDVFISNYSSIYNYNYHDIRTVSFLPLSIAAYWGNAFHWCTIPDMLSGKYNNPRCAKQFINGDLKSIGLQQEVNRLSETPAWDELLEMIDKPE